MSEKTPAENAELLLFNYGSTYRNDYRGGRLKDLVFTKYKEKGSSKRTSSRALKDTHTLSDLKNPNKPLPFNLFWKYNNITRMNPWKKQQAYQEPIDEKKLEAQKTRPRVVMSYNNCLDEIEEPARQILMDNIYTSCTKAQNALVVTTDSLKAPLPDIPAPANVISLQKLRPPYVSPEWRMDSASWEQNSLRAYADSTAEFWKKRPGKCMKCDETAIVVANKNRKRQMMAGRR